MHATPKESVLEINLDPSRRLNAHIAPKMLLATHFFGWNKNMEQEHFI